MYLQSCSMCSTTYNPQMLATAITMAIYRDGQIPVKHTFFREVQAHTPVVHRKKHARHNMAKTVTRRKICAVALVAGYWHCFSLSLCSFCDDIMR